MSHNSLMYGLLLGTPVLGLTAEVHAGTEAPPAQDSASPAQPAAASTANGVEEIVVTPLKRSPGLQKTPIAAHQIREELQAHYDTSRLHLTGGLFYSDEHDDSFAATFVAANPLARQPGTGYTNAFYVGGRQTAKAKAAFGEGTVNVTEQFSVTAGVRYSTERKQVFNQYFVDFVTPYTGRSEEKWSIRRSSTSLHPTRLGQQ